MMTFFSGGAVTIASSERRVFVGIDPHKQQHTTVMLDRWHEELLHLQVCTKPSGFAELLKQVLDATPDGYTPVFAIEDTGGLGRPLAQWLVNHGYLVKGVNPVLSSDQRRRRPHPDKTDFHDAKAVAKVLISDFDELPSVVEDDHYRALREGSAYRDQLVRERTRLKNQLHAALHLHYPDYKEFFSDPFGKAALAFWQAYPHPSRLKGVHIKRLSAFLRRQARNLSTARATKILSCVDKHTPLTADCKMRALLIQRRAQRLHALDEEIAEIDAMLAEQLEQSDTHLITLPGVGVVQAAKLEGRIGPLEGRFSTPDQLARHAGLTPERRDSDGRGKPRRSKSGDRQLNAAFHRMALAQINVTRDGHPHCPVAYEYYHRKIAEGKSKLCALTCLKRRLCDIVFAMLRDRSPYRVPVRSISDTGSLQDVA